MDLGQIKVRCQGVNILHGAIHEHHGLAWTDGQGIFLTPVTIFQGQVENQEHSKLGEFSRGVKSIHWSDNVQSELCYMCVVHERNISIWKVEGRQPKLAFKQIRKINIQPVPQGCLWNPGRDILCALCPQQSSLYYSHTQNKGSQVLLQLERDKIRCGCWTTDGLKLVICIGTTLMVYQWSNIDNSVTQYTTISWIVPGLTGHISSVVSICKDKIVTAAELPLESLCKEQDTFLLPDSLNSNSNGPISEELKDSDVIIPKKNGGTSITDSLLNLQRNPNTVVEDSSRLDCIVLREEKNPVQLCNVKVKGVLTPDLLLYEESHNVLVVGSNSQTLLQIFYYNKDQLNKYQEILINKDERPKGIANLPKSTSYNECGVLIILGKKEPQDSAFPSTSLYINMKSVMKFFHIKQGGYEKNALTHTLSAPSIPTTVSTNGHHDRHDDDKDYDSIYENIVNFNANSKLSSDGNIKLENKENNNVVKVEDISEQKVDEPKVLTEIPKENVLANHSSKDVKSEGEKETFVEPPKRPIRKKKSLRQAREEVVKLSSSVPVSNEAKTSMPMEYLSDSPEMSPRENDRKIVRNDSVKKVSEGVHAGNVNHQTNGENDTKLTSSKVADSSESKIESISDENVQSLPPQKESAREITTLKLGLSDNDSNFSKPQIVEIGSETNGSVNDLEVEKVEFSSQKRNFKHGDIQTLYTEESNNQKVMENIYAERVKQLELSDTRIPDVAGAAQSVSMESLEDIDKILREQNGKISRLQEQMNKLSRRIDESTCVLPYRYKSANKPDLVQVCFCCKDGYKIEKKFLLDNGRLQLNQIKQAFSLETVEIFIDDEACIVGSNIDGYIPLRFEPGSIVNIKGKPAMT
ncbi:hypothetical protein ACF0H5_007242 [Mactra antiquata]